MPVDTNRRVASARPVGRALGGQDRYEKEALEGPAEGPLAMTRRQRLAGGPNRVEGESPFAAKMRKLTESKSKDEER
ncbi:hypothetical protein [Myxococcus qinghaiensis]|uniref:hypothetical protein n=1 Tax=Myxococcus qinghaiensis TaxID=2906758 RepID=UPI0020A81E56|nr:hypothetical protein [Myxococcus qinghaiensis]MCP3165333.1 hypothetical protein [Myxococcus qinghaiensis]